MSAPYIRGPSTLPGAQQYTTAESAASFKHEKFKGKHDENIHENVEMNV